MSIKIANEKQDLKLLQACQKGDGKSAKAALKRGASPHGKPLFAAFENCDADLARLLFDYGADPQCVVDTRSLRDLVADNSRAKKLEELLFFYDRNLDEKPDLAPLSESINEVSQTVLGYRPRYARGLTCSRQDLFPVYSFGIGGPEGHSPLFLSLLTEVLGMTPWNERLGPEGMGVATSEWSRWGVLMTISETGMRNLNISEYDDEMYSGILTRYAFNITEVVKIYAARVEDLLKTLGTINYYYGLETPLAVASLTNANFENEGELKPDLMEVARAVLSDYVRKTN